MADVKWTFFADTAAAERAIQQLEQKFHRLENAQTQMARKSRESSAISSHGFVQAAAKVLAYGGALATIPGALSMIHSETTGLMNEQDALGATLEDNIKKYRVLSGLKVMASDKAKIAVQKAAQVVGVDEQKAWDAAQQLQSSGFDPEVATGSGLLELLKVQAASNETDPDVDSEKLARSIASYLNSQQMPLTAENIRSVGVGVQRLFKATDMGLPDLEEIAKVGASMRGRLTQQEQFSAMSVLRTEGALSGSESGTSMRNIPLFLAAAASEKKKVAALKELGLTPEQVDLTGESFTDVLGLMDQKIKTIAPERVAPVLKHLFGTENISQFQTLIGNRDKFVERLGIQGDFAGFDEDLAVASSGMNVAGKRLRAETGAARADQASRSDIYYDAMENANRNEGGVSRFMSRMKFGAAKPFLGPEWAMQYALGGEERSGFGTRLSPRAQEATDKVQAAQRPAQEQTQLLKEVANATRELVDLQKKDTLKQPALKRNAQVEGSR